MPEGDSVWRAARTLRAVLAGRELLEADLRVPRLATADLSGRVVRDVVPRGKHLLVLMDGLVLHSHLLMDGSWRVYRPGQRWTGGPGHQIRAVLRTEAGTAVGYRVHELRLVRDAAEVVGHLGPDLLGPDWDADAAVRNLTADPSRPIGEALLDQRNLAGIGNIYKAEVLFAGRTHPDTPAGRADLPALVDLAHRLLTANRDRPRRITTGSPRDPLAVYGRARRPCLRCGTPIRAAGRDDRITYWCPACQPPP
ncbi:DNA glycosylase [Actinocorallia sp. API 0066]|uniref:Fpg/Nei family DNA glycosylase n=1 Tax=Actinocorallia sp. API 0066 TaxID=2896846 RepID=UPI001E30A766|nr:DNA-formamidopyrimidine glycosylase family protein [Actinocorallia sp. API 0066]MCD0449877.1 DNA glycosylase [Actinocorallia sp. API 0066]